MKLLARRILIGVGAALLVGGCATAPHTAAPRDIEAGVYLRIVNYNVAKLSGENCTPGALTAVFHAFNEDDKSGFSVAPHVYVCQEVRSTDVDTLLSLLNAAAPAGVSYMLGTYTSNGAIGEDTAAGAQAMFYRPDTLEENESEHADVPTGARRETDRWKLQLVGNCSPDAGF
jgi:hypothetical protein